MSRLALVLVAALAASLALAARADEITAGGIKISSAWTRATPKGAPVGVGYMTITNSGSTADRLVGGASDISNRFEIHEMSMDNGVMRMRPVAQGLEIKPGETVKLEPGGNHVMFVGLRQPIAQGEHVKATLSFEKAGKVEVDFTVENIGAQSAGEHGMHDMKMHGH